MSGVQGHVLGHLVRRGVEAAQYHFAGPKQDYVAQLQQDAGLYEHAGPEMEVKPYEALPMIITVFVAMLIIASVRYTVGEVIASLTMIESPASMAIVDDKPPAYADEPDAPIEKAPLMPSEAEADVEVMLIRTKPITSKITATIGHLTRIGGFRARWRGVGLSMLYHFLHSAFTNLIASFLGHSMPIYSLSYVLVSLALSRVHMVWTHSMIAHPSSKPWWRRMVPRKQSRVILLPTLVFALSQQLTLFVPIMVATALGVQDVSKKDFSHAASGHHCGSAALTVVRFAAIPATGLLMAFAFLLPASVTLTRIEAALLPEDQETIVPFDRLAIMGDVDVTARGAPKAIFAQAWCSIDNASRWRLVKLYAKMVLIQATVAVVALQLIVAEVYLLGIERLALIFKSGVAQLRLMAMDAPQDGN